MSKQIDYMESVRPYPSWKKLGPVFFSTFSNATKNIIKSQGACIVFVEKCNPF